MRKSRMNDTTDQKYVNVHDCDSIVKSCHHTDERTSISNTNSITDEVKVASTYSESNAAITLTDHQISEACDINVVCNQHLTTDSLYAAGLTAYASRDEALSIPEGYAYAIDDKNGSMGLETKQCTNKLDCCNQLFLKNVSISQMCNGCQKILNPDKSSISECDTVHRKLNYVNCMCIHHSFCYQCNMPLILDLGSLSGTCVICSAILSKEHFVCMTPDSKRGCAWNVGESIQGRGRCGITPRRAQACTSTSSEALFCRICHEGDCNETLFSPCKCTGTMGLLHMTCLETWFESTNTNKCEICNFEYFIEREPKTIIEWLSHPESIAERKNLICDIASFLVITPLAAISSWLCLVGANHYSKWHERWEVPGLIALTSFLLSIFFIWCMLAFKYHMHMWYDWRKRNQVIHIHEVHKTNPLQQKSKRRRPCISPDAENIDMPGIIRSVHVQQLTNSPRNKNASMRKDTGRHNHHHHALLNVKEDVNHNSWAETIPILSIDSQFSTYPKNCKQSNNETVNVNVCTKSYNQSEKTSFKVNSSVSFDESSSMRNQSKCQNSCNPTTKAIESSVQLATNDFDSDVTHCSQRSCYTIDIDTHEFGSQLPASAASTPLRGACPLAVPDYVHLDRTAILSFASDISDSPLVPEVMETSF